VKAFQKHKRQTNHFANKAVKDIIRRLRCVRRGCWLVPRITS